MSTMNWVNTSEKAESRRAREVREREMKMMIQSNLQQQDTNKAIMLRHTTPHRCCLHFMLL